ncbi:MAG TPA: GtrA family protein [Xanthobacteraceae bacterium]|jgi:putative flippase GtrA
MKQLLSQMFRFGLVGFVNAGVDAAIFFTALATVTSSLVIANAMAWVVAVTCSYVLNARFTFADHSARGLRGGDYLAFALTQAGGFIAHTLVLVASAPHVPLVVAKVLGIGVGFLVNFSLARTIVFRTR